MRPPLSVEALEEGQFRRIGCWQLDAQTALELEGSAPDEPGVYAFTMDGVAQYVGVASGSLARRFYFYRKPTATQRTNQRMNATLREALGRGCTIGIYVALPPTLHWAGWSMSGPEGLEAGIIKSYALPWNKRGAAPGGGVPAPVAEIKLVEQAGRKSARPSQLARGSLGRYLPLFEFLSGCMQERVSMTFAGLEQLVGPLPKSAVTHRAWWANHEGNAQAQGWMRAGFLVEVDPAHRSVVFRKSSR